MKYLVTLYRNFLWLISYKPTRKTETKLSRCLYLAHMRLPTTLNRGPMATRFFSSYALLFQLASYCSVVLCCRVAPLQKAGIVALIKNRTDDMTLAIGDAANDVSMIQMADVGIGISDQEGRQAVMASDFAMGQFRFLVPLLLVHGHWNYQRMGYMILYNLNTNAILVFVLFWYALFTAFTLTTALTDWSSMLYSIIYTAVPTIVVGILDKDLSRVTLMKYPQLYGVRQRNENYNKKLFWVTMIDTLWQSVVAFFIPVLAYWESDVDISSIGDLWTLAVVILVNVHLPMDVIRWSWITHAAIWGSIVTTFVCVIVIDLLTFLPGYWWNVSASATRPNPQGSFRYGSINVTEHGLWCGQIVAGALITNAME